MFMLRNASKYLFGSATSTKETVIEIPEGQLYLVRPLSPKGYSELIFPDGNCSIRRTGQQFQYQLVVQRVYEEGEEELEAEDGDGDTSGANLSAEKDEKSFLLDESLNFRIDQREGGETVLAWRDLSGDPGDLFEFVCDTSINSDVVADFANLAARCQYERKYRKSGEQASDSELSEFVFGEESAMPQAAPGLGSASSPADTPARRAGQMPRGNTAAAASPSKASPTAAPPVVKNPIGKEVFTNEKAELHLFDFESGTFLEQEHNATAQVFNVKGWDYWFQVSSDSKDWLGQPVIEDLNPVFNFEYRSFIWNYYTDDGSAYSWLLRFADQDSLERFQNGLMRALWEHLNQTSWIKQKDIERDYALSAFQDLTMEDAPPLDEQEEAEESEDEDEEGARSEHFDSDEDEEDVSTKQPKDKDTNSLLAVGFKNDRSFVVRGSKIGVFKHGSDNRSSDLSFQTNINKVATPDGKLFSPKKVMLHAEDRDMILQNPTDSHSLYRMDLEYGKVVDEYKVHDDIAVNTFAPEKKYAQMTPEQTFLGLSGNALYRIDPRLSGNKLVDTQLKQYASKNAFSAAATTASGFIAVASDKGDVRLFDRLGINAKTALPALGDPILGLDVSGDGRWLLATTRTYLLLIDCLQHSGKNEGKLGFEKSFAADSKPTPRRLCLQPEHVAQLFRETKGKGISFTPARFNAGEGSHETSIVTATGPFVVAWSLKKVLAGQKDPYSIKRYTEEVRADDFRYGTDKRVVVALPNEVGMERKSALQRPTRESIAGVVAASPGRRSGGDTRSSFGKPPATPRRGVGGRGSHLRNEIVDSPY